MTKTKQQANDHCRRLKVCHGAGRPGWKSSEFCAAEIGETTVAVPERGVPTIGPAVIFVQHETDLRRLRDACDRSLAIRSDDKKAKSAEQKPKRQPRQGTP